MIDSETKSLWSHILGECMQGELQGEKLPLLIGDMVTWSAWRAEHPRTTVLNLARTSRNYAREFYDEPARFVYGFLVNGQPRHCSLATLVDTPVVNVSDPREPLVVTFDAESTLVRLFSSRVDDRELRFVAEEGGRMRDEATQSVWNRSTGRAIDGPLAGKQLAARAGIASYAASWKAFHPTSQDAK